MEHTRKILNAIFGRYLKFIVLKINFSFQNSTSLNDGTKCEIKGKNFDLFPITLFLLKKSFS